MKKIYMQNNGYVFYSEQQAREYYGDRFEGSLSNGLLHKYVINRDGDVVGEW